MTSLKRKVSSSVEKSKRLKSEDCEKKNEQPSSKHFQKGDTSKHVNVTKKEKKSLSPKEKPNWKEIKKKKVELRKKRKEQKPYDYTIAVQAKKLWEQVRRDDCPPEKRTELLTSLYSIVEAHIEKIVFAHDTARIVQWLLKLGRPDMRSVITRSLKPILVSMMQKRYSSHCVKAVLKYCGTSECKQLVIDALHGNIVKLMGHAVAAPTVDHVYSEWASPAQRRQFQCEFYGDIYKISLDKQVTTIEAVLAISPEVKSSVLENTKNCLVHIINKGLVFSRLLHTVVLEYLNVCTLEDKNEILNLLHQYVLDVLRTKEGARLSMMCCWSSTTKEKKKYMRDLKGRVKEIALMEYGCLFLLALLDSVDDTVALNKYVLKELVNNAVDIAGNEHGRRVILYTVAHRDSVYFHPDLIKTLKAGDESEFKKKSTDVRQSEIRESVVSVYLESIASNISSWFANGSIAMVALAILRIGKGKVQLKAVDALVEYICSDSTVTEDEKEYLVVEHSALHMVFKKLVQQDRQNKDQNESFSICLARKIDEEGILKWIVYNRACFLLVAILESGIDSAVESLKQKFTERIKTKLKELTSVGSKILLKNVQSDMF